MTQDNKLFQDISRLANSAISGAANVKNELSNFIKLQIEMLLKNMNFVTREEFEIVKKIAEKNSLDIKKLLKTKDSDSINKNDVEKNETPVKKKKT